MSALKVKCLSCGREIDCMTMQNGTVYKPFAWFFPDESSLEGYCLTCPQTVSTSSDKDWPPLTIEGLKQALADQTPGPWANVYSLEVSPDVFDFITRELPRSERESLYSIRILVNKNLPKGTMVPFDCDGNPLPKPDAP